MCQVKLVGHSDIRPVLHCGRDRATYWLKIANFSYPCISMSAYLFGPAFPTQVAGSAFPGLPFSGPLFFGPPFSTSDIWALGLMVVHFPVLHFQRTLKIVTDRRTDGRTDS